MFRDLKNIAFGTLWLASVLFGFLYLIKYENKPGQQANTPVAWPKQNAISYSKHKPTLVMLLHPKCSCSKASVDELARLIALFPKRFETTLLFFHPEDEKPKWAKDALWNKAKDIPYTKLISDKSGSIAKAFGATTSGHTVLYGTNGQLLFNGGITPSRAHAGDSTGKKAIIDILKSGTSTKSEALTFGCDIFDPTTGI